MNKLKNTYSGIFRDGGVGRLAKKRYRVRRKRLIDKESKKNKKELESIKKLEDLL